MIRLKEYMGKGGKAQAVTVLDIYHLLFEK